MILVTCKAIDCPTPHFYVNLSAGKVQLTFPLDSPDANIPPPQIAAAKVAVNKQFKLTQETPEKFTNEEIELIKEWYEQMQKQIPQENFGITTFEEIEEATDYLIVYCESNHQNYIALKDLDTPLEDSNHKNNGE
ncbi:hypothetical protein MTsPCn5_28820 [Croceitalea sp. MTPC5]|uniref:hypothetical protein n=1 Tax=Croceitalea sp. MTPC5 TaxID=3056565 RepID=UPI002B365733|nr:hypothetical protein MTsPCn5_28820 [Croceitalea sp. MTPC5]